MRPLLPVHGRADRAHEGFVLLGGRGGSGGVVQCRWCERSICDRGSGVGEGRRNGAGGLERLGLARTQQGPEREDRRPKEADLQSTHRTIVSARLQVTGSSTRSPLAKSTDLDAPIRADPQPAARPAKVIRHGADEPERALPALDGVRARRVGRAVGQLDEAAVRVPGLEVGEEVG